MRGWTSRTGEWRPPASATHKKGGQRDAGHGHAEPDQPQPFGRHVADAGQGAAQALEDAAVLHALFASSSSFAAGLHDDWVVEKMFAAYDTVRRPRSQAVVDLARRFGRVYAFAEDGMHEEGEKACVGVHVG